MKPLLTKPLDRRTVLRGAGGVALGLPFLEAMRPRRARAQEAAPRRIIFVFKPNGNEHSTRFRSTGETNFVLGEFLEPLEPYRSQLLFLNGVDKKIRELPRTERADDHQQGGASLAPWPSGSGSFKVGGTNLTIGYVEGPSADYVLGERVLAAHRGVRHRHLVYRVGGGGNNIWNVASHGGPVGKQNPIAPETDPFNAYTRIFSFTGGDNAAQAAARKRLAMKQSALGLVNEEARALRARLGADDRMKLDQHLQSLSDIERGLSGLNPSLNASCEPVMMGNRIDPNAAGNHAMIGRLFFKMMAMALACDHTRVISFAWGGNTNNRVYSNLGISEGHHDISHNSSAGAFAKIRQIHRHLWTQSVFLHEELKAIRDGEGTLWDNTLVFHWNELGQGDNHSTNNDLIVLAGGAHRKFRMGRLLQYNRSVAFADVLVAAFHYMGFTDVTSFGDPRLNNNRLPPGIMA